MATTGWRYSLGLPTIIEAARELPCRGLADVNRMISHSRRRKVIREWMTEHRPPGSTLVLPKGDDANSQELLLWEGTMLTAVLDGLSKHGIYNAQLLVVRGWTDTTLQLECQEGGQEYEVPRAWAQENLRHGCCITYAAIQARTCRGTVQLLDWDSRRFTRRHLVMGLSRATSIEKVWLGPALSHP